MSTISEVLATLGVGPIGAMISFGFGLLWGSFFNVCILRIPADQSVVFDHSRCPNCLTALKWYMNIPVLSYLFLRAKCATCKTRISIQYPLVELLSGVLFVWLFFNFGWSLRFLLYGVFCAALLVISVIDLYHQIIPDELSLPGIVLGFMAALILPDVTWQESLLGIVCGGGIFLLVAYGYEKIAGREGLGGGDVKLLAMIGAWLGYQSILIVVIISSFLGAAIGITLMMIKGKDFKMAIPFGPFLAVAAFLYLFWGDIFRAVLFPNFH